MMKLKMLLLSMALVFSMPNFAAAHEHESTPVDHDEKPCNCKEDKHRHLMHKDWQAMMKEREQKLLSWVDQYTPDKKGEWTKVLEEKKTLRNQWMSPENAAKREQWKKEKMTKMEELKKQLDEGKITKEEFMKKAHHGKKMGHWKIFHDLRLAVDKKDDKQAAVLLNQLLVQMKEHNQMMKEMLKK
ncbi:hypothetical protein RCG19_19085 [Neobacillus sp. OS1-2]|uniref:hypothetical protein n=1 Tax=Neobacillus sp. OS1-2 TaxID=3070680 RepID=UPI0027E03A2A|nr:hypothetical protein [Neobacillus sp. OS1-2]WML39266.1 hypothetical protein RCG19_19085 [Neobacillus sp. OS1-2]